MHAASGPALRILTMRPLTLAGERFRPHESVQLQVSADGEVTVAKVRASESGAFTAVFEAVRTGRCVAELTVEAVGGLGSSAGFTLNQIQRAGDDMAV